MKRTLVTLILAMALPFNVHGAWISVTSTIQTIKIYSTTDTILVTLDHPGTVVSECSNTLSFAIDGTLPVDRRKQMLSALLMTKAAGNSITLTYSDSGNCVPWDADVNAYRGLVRIIF